MFLLSLTATCQVCTVSLKAGLSTYNEVREDGEHRMTGSALDPPDGDATEAHPYIMGVACQTPAAATGRLVRELKADRKDEGEDELDKRFGIAQECKVGRLIVEVDGNRTVLAGRCGSLSHGSPSVEMAIGTNKSS